MAGKEGSSEELERIGARLEAGLAPFGRVQRVGAMLTLFCREAPVRDYEDASAWYCAGSQF